MTDKLEELQAAKDNILYAITSNMSAKDLLDCTGTGCTIRTVLDEAISKAEAEKVDYNGLLPCPFCGGEVHIVKAHCSDMSDWIRHDSAPVPCGLEGFGENVDVGTLWNTRAAHTIEPIDGLEEAIDILEVHMADMGDMAVVLVAARAYLTLTKRGG